MTITLHGRIPSKKNSKRIVYAGHRPVVISSKDHEAWHTIASYELAMQMRAMGFRVTLDGIKEIIITIFSENKVKSDLSNKAESIIDLLVDNCVIRDDNWFEVPRLVLNFGGVDKSNPRAEVQIN